MNRSKPKDKTGRGPLRLLLGIAVLALLPVLLLADSSSPSWWQDRGIQNSYPANDYAAVNQGQVKNIAVKAVAEMDASLPGGAGEVLHTLATNLSGTTANTNDYAAVNIGQLKTVSKPFLDRLLQVGYQGHPLESGTYPWVGRESSANDYAMANIGQVKNLFSFDLTFKTDPNNPLPDWWQMKYFGKIGVDPANDPDGDGVTTADEFLQGTNPMQSLDLNNNGLPDDWELFHANSFAAWPSPVGIALSLQQSGTQTLILNNATTQPVQYSVTLTNNLVQGQEYSFQDSKADNVTYTWEEISTTGTLISALSGMDDASSRINFTTFIFPFYGSSYSSVYVGSNGYLTFGNGNTAYTNSSLPSPSAPVNMIAPFWDDLIISSPGAIYYKEESDRFIVQYQDVNHYGGGGTYTFQVVLFSSGRIELRYKSMSGTKNSCTVGIQNANGTGGLQMAYNQAYLENNLAVRISPPRFVDVTPLSGTVAAGAQAQLAVEFNAQRILPGSYTANIQISPNGLGETLNIPVILEIQDTDHDGMPDWWEIANGLNPNDPSDAYADPDGDGYPSFYEFIHNTNPKNASLKPTPEFIVDQSSGPYWSIQDAINAVTQDYQIIKVNPGAYSGNITISTHKILLISASGAASTIISGYGYGCGSVISVNNDSAVNGFTVTNGSADQWDGTPGSGGGILIQGGSPRFTNCVIRGNNASAGAAVYSSGNAPVFLNCTIANNTITTPTLGQAVVAASGKLTLVNSILWNPSVQAELSGAGLNISYSDVRTAAGTIVSGSGNINADPMLTADGHLYASLAGSSPCVGTANPSLSPKTDMDGELRDAMPDMGADEFLDSNGNQLPDWWEQKYSLTGPGVLGNATTPRGDGLTYLEAYISGRNPLDLFDSQTPSLDILTGDQQSGEPDVFLPEPICVRVSNSFGPVINATVAFGISGSQGALAATGTDNTSASVSVQTGTDGVARVYAKPWGNSGTMTYFTATSGANGNTSTTWITAYPVAAPPQAASNLIGVAQAAAFHLAWTDNSENEQAFIVERSSDNGQKWTEIARTVENATSYDDSAGITWEGFSYRVIAERWESQSAPTNVVTTSSDSDGDGMPDIWEKNHGLDPNDATDALGDADRDGFPAIYEYTHNTDPQAALSAPVADVFVNKTGTSGTSVAYTTIQHAIDSITDDYKIIKVDPGTYNENLTTGTHRLMLVSSKGAAATIISGTGGGSVVRISSDVVMNGFTITSGSGTQSGTSGSGGGIFIQSGSPRLTNCVIKENSAAVGAAIYSSGSSPVLVNCTVSGNSSTSGAAVVVASGSMTLTNTILWNSSTANEISGTGLTASYSDIRGGLTGTGNINADPLLMADYHLMANSPCRGIANFKLSPLVDMDGDPRGGNSSDIGADEFGLPQWWQMQYFGHVGIEPNADNMGDGLTNFEKWQLGLDPTQFDPRIQPTDSTPPVITITKPAGVILTP